MRYVVRIGCTARKPATVEDLRMLAKTLEEIATREEKCGTQTKVEIQALQGPFVVDICGID